MYTGCRRAINRAGEQRRERRWRLEWWSVVSGVVAAEWAAAGGREEIVGQPNTGEIEIYKHAQHPAQDWV